MYILFQILFHYRLLSDIEYNLPCYMVDLYCLFYILNQLFCVCEERFYFVNQSFLFIVLLRVLTFSKIIYQESELGFIAWWR